MTNDYLIHSLLKSLHIFSGLPVFSSSGSKSSLQFCQQTGLTKRLIEDVPTEVKRLSDVAGNGPPCIIALPTSTPVGGPFNITLPAMFASLSVMDLYFGSS